MRNINKTRNFETSNRSRTEEKKKKKKKIDEIKRPEPRRG